VQVNLVQVYAKVVGEKGICGLYGKLHTFHFLNVSIHLHHIQSSFCGRQYIPLKHGTHTYKMVEKFINNHYENMKNYIRGTCRKEGWVGGEWFQSQCGHVDREKNSCLWKEQNPGMPIHFYCLSYTGSRTQ